MIASFFALSIFLFVEIFFHQFFSSLDLLFRGFLSFLLSSLSYALLHKSELHRTLIRVADYSYINAKLTKKFTFAKLFKDYFSVIETAVFSSALAVLAGWGWFCTKCVAKMYNLQHIICTDTTKIVILHHP